MGDEQKQNIDDNNKQYQIGSNGFCPFVHTIAEESPQCGVEFVVNCVGLYCIAGMVFMSTRSVCVRVASFDNKILPPLKTSTL